MSKRIVLLLSAVLIAVVAGLVAFPGLMRDRGNLSLTGAWFDNDAPEDRSDRPNILLVVYDARRRDDFSFGPFANRRNDTPFLSAFKDEASFFESAVSPGCWTVPVHAAIFSGLTICELGIDYYNPGFSSFPDHFLSLAEILKSAGYHTIAYPDHPFFYSENIRKSLIRGFEQFNVVGDFERYGSYSNIGSKAGEIEHHYPLVGMEDMSMDELRDLVQRFNRGEIHFDLSKESDYDPDNDVYLPKLKGMFQRSEYFRRRYGEEFDRHVFNGDERPYFMFLNLHMCTPVALPDPALYHRWYLKALMMNAQRRGVLLSPLSSEDNVERFLETMHSRLRLKYGRLYAPGAFMKHVFDNRFYDECFREVWEYLERRGLTRNTVTIVTSDHGLSFREQGEATYAHGGARPYEYMTRVPLVVRFPRESELSRFHGLHREKVSLLDLFPTIVSLGLGEEELDRKQPVRGRDLVERLETGEYEQVVVAESALRPNKYYIRPGTIGYSKALYSDRYKLIYAPRVRTDSAGTWDYRARLDETTASSENVENEGAPLAFLYDLSVNPFETNDLAALRPEIVEQMTGFVPSWSCRPGTAGAEAPVWDEDAIKSLRALGYIK